MRHWRFDHPDSGGDSNLGRGRGAEILAGLRPAWFDLTLLRRLAAVTLAAVAALIALRADPGGAQTSVVVAAHTLRPGQVLGAADLRRATLPSAALPEGVVTDAAQLVGAISTGAVHTGEILTDLRTVSPRLAAAATGAPDARIVPMRLADNAIAEILRAGDRVDVVAADEGHERSPTARTLATDAAVVLVSAPEDSSARSRESTDRVVLLALDPDHATAVAAASLHTAMTVVFH